MNTMNNFTVTGYVCKDAEVKQFEKAAIARFGVILKHTEKRNNETTTTSAIMSLETWLKKDDAATLALLTKGKAITVEGFFKPENYTKDGNVVTIIKNIVTKISPFVREKKEEETAEETKA